MKSRFATVLLAVLVCLVAVACAPDPIDEPKPIISVCVDGVDTEFSNLQDAINSVAAGKSATVTVNRNISLTELIEIKDKTITIVDGGEAVTITDAIPTVNFVEYNSNDVCCCFRVHGTGRLILKGSETGGLTFRGAGSEATSTARIMFYLGTGYKTPDTEISGYLEFNRGVTVTNIHSTIFGALVRAYGEVVINGGTFSYNYVQGNGLFAIYSKLTIHDCLVSHNDTPNVGIFQLCSCATTDTVVNGGVYEYNTSAKRAAVFNTYAVGSFVLNGGTFRNNSVTAAAGGAIYIVSANTITGGTFENNTPYDFYVDKTAVAGLNKAETVVATVKVAI